MLKTEKLISLLLCLLMLTAMFSGCSKEPGEAEAQKVTYVYKQVSVAMPDDIQPGNSMFIKDGRIYSMSMKILDEKTYETATVLCSFDFDGENIEIEEIPTEKSDTVSQWYNYYTINPDGTRISLVNIYNQETQENIFVLEKASADETVIWSIEPKDLFDPSSGGNDRFGGGDYFYINHCVSDADGLIYLAKQNSMLVLSAEGKKLFEISFSNWIDKLNVSANGGKVYVQYYDYEHGGGRTTRYIDPVKKGLGDELVLPEGVNFGYNYEIMTGPGYDMYIKNEKGIYGYNNADSEPVMLLDWVNSDVNFNSTYNNMTILSADKFVYSGYDEITGKANFYILTKVPDDEVQPKVLINIGYIYADTYFLNLSVINFNRKNDKYRIITTNYGAYNTDQDYNMGVTKLVSDISSGKSPDIIIDYSTPEIQALVKKNTFEDLYYYFDGDPDIDRGVLLKCVRNAMEMNGKLYQLPTNFTINTLVGKTSNLKGMTSWTLAEMMDFINALPDGVSPIQYGVHSILTQRVWCDNFIDVKNNTCSFDSPEFIKMLNYLKSLPDESQNNNQFDDYYDNNKNRVEDYRENKIILYDSYLSSFSDYLQTRFKFGFDEDITFIGLPTNSGAGTIFNYDSAFSISVKSKVKDGAWEFLKSLLSDDIQTSRILNHTWSVTVNGIKKAAENDMKNSYFFMYSGGWSASTTISSDDEEGDSGNTIIVDVSGRGRNEGEPGKLTEEDIQYMTDFLDSQVMISPYEGNQVIYDILAEELLIFFEGQKSAEDTAAVVQNRISLYLHEQS